MLQSPLIVVEVLSPSTERYDRTEKFARYMLCPTLEVYILVSQDEQHIEVYRRSMGWKQERFSAGQTVKLEQLDQHLFIGGQPAGLSGDSPLCGTHRASFRAAQCDTSVPVSSPW
jgi:hypothetical protein